MLLHSTETCHYMLCWQTLNVAFCCCCFSQYTTLANIDKRRTSHHGNYGSRGHIMHQTGIEGLLAQGRIMLWQQLFRHLRQRDNTRQGGENVVGRLPYWWVCRLFFTCSIFRPTSWNPRISKRWMIWPMRRLWTPSGLTAIRVRSLVSLT